MPATPTGGETVARSITDPSARAQALTAGAQAVAAAGEPDPARQLGERADPFPHQKSVMGR
jgi:hypothetical protein